MKVYQSSAYFSGFLMGTAAGISLGLTAKYGLWLLFIPFMVLLISVWCCGIWERRDRSTNAALAKEGL
jgi:hypothetical protein